MKAVQIDDESYEKLMAYCEAKNLSTEHVLKGAVNTIYSRLKVKYDWKHDWSTNPDGIYGKLSKEQKEEVITKLNGGARAAELAKEYGVSRQTIYNIKYAAGKKGKVKPPVGIV